jgi:Trypsin
MFFRSKPKSIRLGELTKIQYFGVQRIIKHPNYKHSSHYDDIALIELDGRAEMNRYVLPACLWPTHNFNFERMDAAGWGLDQTGEWYATSDFDKN